ncbi:MAG: nucleoside monophosphate kinase [Acidobacteria bacterium]|nr:nucleoside monophosphate kinase [Acidobacteriota bacterium]
MRILIFGPNGSGKGTQSAILVKKTGLTHIESGGIFREHAKKGTELGKKAKTYTDQGQLVPDEITIPMIVDRLSRSDCANGWILDGFPRNPSQAMALIQALEQGQTPLDVVIEIRLAREVAKARLMGRATCPNGHPNNTAIPAIAPIKSGNQLICAKCQQPVTVRQDDIDEQAIDVRLNIYFDEQNGTVSAIRAVESWAANRPDVNVIHVDGEGDIQAISETIAAALGR